jgi:hypothetical protein
LDPFVDGEVTFTPEAAGWHCSKVELHEEQSPHSGARAPTAGQDRSVDYVTARAPSGSTQAGVNFPAVGYISFQSSQRGRCRGAFTLTTAVEPTYPGTTTRRFLETIRRA